MQPSQLPSNHRQGRALPSLVLPTKRNNNMNKRKITHIFVHCTATLPTATVESIQQGWRSIGWKNPGYHYIIKADAIATQAHAAVRTDTATTHTVSRDTVRQQTTTADTTAAHYRRATWQQADTTFTEIWINARRFRYHDGATASTASHKETRAATSTAIDTDSCRLISRADTISAVQKKHEDTDRRPLDRAVLGYSVYTAFVLIVVLIILLYIIGRLKN
mgnify:CR=1 FL=1